MDYLPWTEKYRPKKLDEVTGQKDIIESLRLFAKAKNMPNLLFAGPPGVGKTTSALALAIELFGEHYRKNFLELNASDERGIGIVRGRIKDFARSVSLDEAPFKIIFLDEADALTTDAQQALRRTMETYSGVTRFILSCNYSSKIIEPLQSRCAIMRFMELKNEDILKMINYVAAKENLKLDEKAIKAIYYISEGDMRKVLTALQGAALHSRHITEKIIYAVSGVGRPEEIKDMITVALDGDFKKARALLGKLMVDYGLSGDDIVVQMYRNVRDSDGIADKLKMRIISSIADANFKIVEGANDRIQLEALLAIITLLGQKQ